MIEIKVIGHKIPDTDCTLSAIIASDYLSKKGYKATPYIQGKLNKETEFLLKKLDIKTPEIKTSFEKNTNICLVDHNECSQTPDNLTELNTLWIIDHHKMNFHCSSPLNIRIEPLCSTASILYKMYIESNFNISKEIATMMLACVLSDSLLFRSATTTKEDIEIADKLKIIAGVDDLESFALPMFNAKSDLGDISIENLIKYDYKEFIFNNKKIGVGTLETTNPEYALSRKKEILIGLEKIKKQDDLEFLLLSVVDIIGEQNTSIVLNGKDSEIIEKVFNTKVVDNLADLKNRLSRKKQIIPELTSFFIKK